MHRKKSLFSLQQKIPLQTNTTDQNSGNSRLRGDQLQLMQLLHIPAHKEHHKRGHGDSV